MARAGRKDRGLLSKPDSTGKLVWYVRLYHEGRERRFGSFPNKTQARDFYEKAKQEQKSGRFFPERYQRGGYELVEDMLNRYLTTLSCSGKTPSTITDERFYGAWWSKRLCGKRVNQLTPDLLEQIKSELTEKSHAPQTILHYMKFLRHVLYATVGKSALPQNPFEKVKLKAIRAGRTRFLSPKEEAQLYEAIGPTYAPWVRLAILTGMRKSEQFRLRWTDVDLEHGFLTLGETKSGTVQYVPLTEESIAILRNLDSWQRSKWVFPSQNPQTHLNVDNFYGRVYLPAVKQAGLEGVTWHTLRHTFASRLAMSGQSPSTIAALLRHSGVSLVARYAHLDPSHLKSAVEGVASFGKRIGAESKPFEDQTGIVPSISNGTVTRTGIERNEENEKTTEVVEKIGRGERI